MFIAELDWSNEVEELLRDAAGPGNALPSYGTSSESRLVGWLVDRTPVTAAGLVIARQVVTVGHIGTRSELRGPGHGAELIRATAADVAPLPLVAETDDDAVGFYRGCGFVVREVDSPWPTARYRCVLR